MAELLTFLAIELTNSLRNVNIIKNAAINWVNNL
jgi:hypothetical protein